MRQSRAPVGRGFRYECYYAKGPITGSRRHGFRREDLLRDLLTVDMRCLDGYGIYLWRRGDLAAAADVFRRLLWLNPHDNTGTRFNLAAIEAGSSWEAASVP